MRSKLNWILIFFSVVVILLTGSALIFIQGKKGIEKNGVLGEKKTDLASLRCPNCNVILIGIDTLRADHLSSYGYFRNTSPNIDKFAEKGVLFRNTFSASSKTTPSFMSMFTSLYPTDHGVLRIISSSRRDALYTRINDSVKTLAEVLKEQGYVTQALVSTPQLPIEFGFDRGFDKFEVNMFTDNRNKLLQWLKDNKDKKFFVFFHDMGPHDPYDSAQPYNTLYDPEYKGKITTELKNIPEISDMKGKRTLEKTVQEMNIYKKEVKSDFWSNVDDKNPKDKDIYHLEALYDGEIKFLDDFIGKLQGILEEHNLLENTIIIFTADHGEEFFEHGDFIHRQVYNEILKVPFILASPSLKDKLEISEYVSTLDIMPTIMDFLNIPSLEPLRGRSLLPIIHNPSEDMNLPIVAMQYTHKIPPIKTIIRDNYKLILKDSSQELYDLYSDSKELLNLSDKKRDIANELSNDLQKQLNDSRYIYKSTPLDFSLDEDTREKLESLGY